MSSSAISDLDIESPDASIRDLSEFVGRWPWPRRVQAMLIEYISRTVTLDAGDVIVVLSGSEIHFHGMIGQLSDGWAIASDRRGSLLAATVQ